MVLGFFCRFLGGSISACPNLLGRSPASIVDLAVVALESLGLSIRSSGASVVVLALRVCGLVVEGLSSV